MPTRGSQLTVPIAALSGVLAMGCGRIWFEARDGDTDDSGAGMLDGEPSDAANTAQAVLFATIGRALVTIDGTTAEPTVFETLEMPIEYMTFDGTWLRAVAPTPEGFRLIKLDPCTGAPMIGQLLSSGRPPGG